MVRGALQQTPISGRRCAAKANSKLALSAAVTRTEPTAPSRLHYLARRQIPVVHPASGRCSRQTSRRCSCNGGNGMPEPANCGGCEALLSLGGGIKIGACRCSMAIRKPAARGELWSAPASAIGRDFVLYIRCVEGGAREHERARVSAAAVEQSEQDASLHSGVRKRRVRQWKVLSWSVGQGRLWRVAIGLRVVHRGLINRRFLIGRDVNEARWFRHGIGTRETSLCSLERLTARCEGYECHHVRTHLCA